MLLFKQDEDGRSYIKSKIVEKDLYNNLKEEINYKILKIELNEKYLKLYLSDSTNIYMKDIEEIQKETIKFLENQYSFAIAQVDIEIL